MYLVIGKLYRIYHKFYSTLKLKYYVNVSKHRFTFGRQIIIGKRFSINSDISSTYVNINDHVRIRDGFQLTIGHGGRLSIGKHSFFNNNCSINCLGEIKIGDNTQFGEYVLMYDHNHQYINGDKLISEQGYKISSIEIGNNCWIGSGVIILQGVTIGNNVVIGAGCIIHKSISSGSIVVNHQDLRVSGKPASL